MDFVEESLAEFANVCYNNFVYVLRFFRMIESLSQRKEKPQMNVKPNRIIAPLLLVVSVFAVSAACLLYLTYPHFYQKLIIGFKTWYRNRQLNKKH